jgi:hypothetical protein
MQGMPSPKANLGFEALPGPLEAAISMLVLADLTRASAHEMAEAATAPPAPSPVQVNGSQMA